VQVRSSKRERWVRDFEQTQWRGWSVAQKEGKAWGMALVEWCRCDSLGVKWNEDPIMKLGKGSGRNVHYTEFRGPLVKECVENVKADVRWFMEKVWEKAGVRVRLAEQALESKNGERCISVDVFLLDGSRNPEEWEWLEVKRGGSERTRTEAMGCVEKLGAVAVQDVEREWTNLTARNATKNATKKLQGTVQKPRKIGYAIIVGKTGAGELEIHWRQRAVQGGELGPWDRFKQVWSQRQRGQQYTGKGNTEEKKKKRTQDKHARYNKRRREKDE